MSFWSSGYCSNSDRLKTNSLRWYPPHPSKPLIFTIMRGVEYRERQTTVIYNNKSSTGLKRQACAGSSTTDTDGASENEYFTAVVPQFSNRIITQLSTSAPTGPHCKLHLMNDWLSIGDTNGAATNTQFTRESTTTTRTLKLT